jgi:hypothetical protein
MEHLSRVPGDGQRSGLWGESTELSNVTCTLLSEALLRESKSLRTYFTVRPLVSWTTSIHFSGWQTVILS